MKNKIWFKAKKYGFGWYPATWQGWLVILAYVAFVVYWVWKNDSAVNSARDAIFGFAPQIIFATALLIFISWLKGEPARWRWGDDDKKD